MGVTFLYASGDWGVAGFPANNSNDERCLFPNGTESSNHDAKGFNPSFPGKDDLVVCTLCHQVIDWFRSILSLCHGCRRDANPGRL